jgi:predicted glycoside hydrolase/deacetylase ChbG (UPF0249 family)
MKTTLMLLIVATVVQAGEPAAIRLLIRGDDIGSSHAANLGCMESFERGIMRSVELMPVTPWFPEAVRLLNEHPGLDVGIHLTLTSEWSNVKWRPLKPAASLTDEDGFFYPMVWPNKNLLPRSSIHEAAWRLEEIECELRAQIELTQRRLPHASHLSSHMGFTSLDARIEKLVLRLAKEYRLGYRYVADSLHNFRGWEQAVTRQERIDRFADNLAALKPGVYLFVDHPAVDTPEMRAIHHPGYDNVAQDRDMVLSVFTAEKVLRIIEEKKIELISYKNLRSE